MIVAFEGADAAGKATQTKLLQENLKGHGINTELLSFPAYKSLAGKYIMGNLKREWSPQFSAWGDGEHTESEKLELREIVFQALMTVDKLQYYDIIKTYANDPFKVLVLDRYYLSGIIYGGMGGLPTDWLHLIHSCLPEPDVTFYLDITLEESKRRRPERRDRIESDYEYLSKVRNAYLEYFAARQDRPISDKQYIRVNGELSMSWIEQHIYENVLAKHLGLGLGEMVTKPFTRF